jgi:hypothetical protein
MRGSKIRTCPDEAFVHLAVEAIVPKVDDAD